MPVQDQTPYNQHTGNGVTTVFAYGFRLLTTTDLDVYLAGVLQASGFTVTGVGASGGGTVVFAVAPGNGVAVLLQRDIETKRETDYQNAGDLLAETLDADFDRLWMAIQGEAERNDRQLTLLIGSTVSGNLPAPGAAQFLRANAGLTALEWVDLVTSGAIGIPVSLAQGGTGGVYASAAALRAGIGAGDLLSSSFTTKGDVLVASAANTPARLGVGANGTIPMARSAAAQGMAYVAALTKTIYGLTYANNGADAANDIDIAAGGAVDATGAYWMTAAALTKQSDVAWAVGTAAGGLDTGAVGNNDYYIWLIARSDTGVVDVLFSLSSTAPTMPGSYDFKRLIGWFKRAAGTIVAFTTYEAEGGGLQYLWAAPGTDVALLNTLTTARRTDALRVPLNFSVMATINVMLYDAALSGFAWIYCPDQGDSVPSITSGPLANIGWTGGSVRGYLQAEIRTSATGTIAARANIATVDEYYVSCLGFRWSRR